MGFHVEYISLEQTSELRRSVLRPHDHSDPLLDDANGDMIGGSFAAIDDRGRIIGAARVRLVSTPSTLERFAPVGASAWQLRGMATREDLRGQGVGAALMAAVVDHVASSGGGLLWCNARRPAAGFYERTGFVAEGAEWNEPFIGPHIKMWRIVDPA